MIGLGLRLALGSGREAALRMLVTAAAVALGVGLLLCALAGVNGLHAQAERGAWLDTTPQSAPSASATARLWWLLTVDQFGTQEIDRVDVAAAGPGAPVPPGVPALPGPGEYYASPAMTALLRAVPAGELADRYPGREVGVLGAAALPSPNSLVILVGRDAAALSALPGAVEVRGIQRSLSNCYSCASGVGSGPVLRWILAGGAVALLLPVLILIATAGRLSAARREERFAAMRLVGATPRQISVVSAVEALVGAMAGIVAGFGLFFACSPLLYHVPFTGAPLAPGDLSLSGLDVVLVAVGVPLAATISARWSLRRAQHSPLSVRRRAAPRPPRAFRLAPLVAGIGLLAYFDVVGRPGNANEQLLELLAGFVLVILGLVVAGPWLTTAGSRLMARHASRPATLLAGRRLLDDPRAAFRSISGLVLALFVSTAVIGALSSIEGSTGSRGGAGGADTLADLFCSFGATNCPRSEQVGSVPSVVVARLRATTGTTAVILLHAPPAPATVGPFGGRGSGGPEGLVVCRDLAGTPAIGRCSPGAATATVGWFLTSLLGHDSHAATTVWPTASLSPAEVAQLPVDAVVVATNGSSGAVERARTALELAFPAQGTSRTVTALDPGTARLLATLQDMTDVVIVASLIIASCGLAVNVAAGLGDRRRPFSLLRLTGVPTGVLQRVVALESALPLLLVAAVAIAVGFSSSALYLSSQVGIRFRIPGGTFWATVVGGLAGALAIIGSTFPLLRRVTGPEVARNE